jgi:predicted ArsR family transcriptional regulator
MDLLAEPRTSVELAEAMGLTRAGVLKWLNRLIEEGKVEAVGGRHSSPLRRYRRVASEERASRSHPRQSGSALASDRKVLERLSQMSSVDRILLALELGERDRMLRG